MMENKWVYIKNDCEEESNIDYSIIGISGKTEGVIICNVGYKCEAASLCETHNKGIDYERKNSGGLTSLDISYDKARAAQIKYQKEQVNDGK